MTERRRWSIEEDDTPPTPQKVAVFFLGPTRGGGARRYLKPADEVADAEGPPPSSVPMPKNPFSKGGLGSMFGGVVKAALSHSVEDAAALATEGGGDWICDLDRDQIMEVWAAKHPQASWDAAKCKAHVLLTRYNGDFAEFFEIQKQQLAARQRETAQSGTNRLVRDQDAVVVETDLDARCRQLQDEMDKAINNSNSHMNSAVLHGGVEQRYPTTVLRLELERELDCLLREQVYKRERATRFLLEQDDEDAQAQAHPHG